MTKDISAPLRLTPWPGVSEPVDNPDLRILSLGAGVQSTTLALMAAEGLLGAMPDAALFADTGWEPQAVYDHLAWLESGPLPFPVHRVQGINLRQTVLDRARGAEGRFISVPFFLSDGGMGRRQCTKEAKIDPIRKKVRELLGLRKGAHATNKRVELWLGISTDELQRMKAAQQKWLIHRWPLIEARMSRADCLSWLKRHGYPEPPKSACIGCPFRSDASWRQMRQTNPEEFGDAVNVDAALRAEPARTRLRKAEFMHPSRQPLSNAPLDDDKTDDLFGFLNECDGLCGT